MSKEKELFCPQRQKSSFSNWLGTTVAIINLARRCCYFHWTFGKILKEGIVMVFGNNSQVTGKEMDFPSGWQFVFAAHGVWIYACSKSGCCQEWLSWDCEPMSSKKRRDSTALFCLCIANTTAVLCLWALDIATSFKTCGKSFERSFYTCLRRHSVLTLLLFRASISFTLLFFSFVLFVFLPNSKSIFSLVCPCHCLTYENETFAFIWRQYISAQFRWLSILGAITVLGSVPDCFCNAFSVLWVCFACVYVGLWHQC